MNDILKYSMIYDMICKGRINCDESEGNDGVNCDCDESGRNDYGELGV